MCPNAQLEIDSVVDSLRADELEHLKIAIAFFFRQIDRAHIVTRDGKQKRIGKQEVGVANIIEEVVTNAQVETETVKTLGSQHGKISGPHLAVIEPWLDLDIATKDTSNAANGIEGALGDGLALVERRKGMVGVLNAIGKFEQSVHQAASV